jgi:lipopolysaccharide export system protein LptC
VNCLTIASQIEGAGSGGFLAPSPRDNRRAFRAAMRHSRLVRFTRVGIPVAIVLVAAVFGTYRWLDPMRALAKLPIGADAVLLSGTKIVMRQPRLTGYTKDERPYTMTARTAAKDLANPDVLEMEDVRTTIVMPDGRNVELTATEGFYDSSPEFEITLKDAVANVRGGTVVSDNPVEIQMLQGTLKANRIEVAESGAIIRFEGGVTLVIDRDDTTTSVTGAVR